MATLEKLDRGVTLTWLGHATFLIETGGQRLLVDPWIENNPMAPGAAKELGEVDSILVTHGHFDHASEVPAVAAATKAKRVVCSFECGEYFKKKGVEGVVDMNLGGTVDCDGVAVTMTAAAHSCGITDDDGSILYGGPAAGFVIEAPGAASVYHAGDTDVFGDMALIRRLLEPEIALLPIGGHYTMGPKGAAVACELLGSKSVVPMHHGTFPLLAGTPDQLRAELSELGLAVEVLDMEPGDVLR